MTGLKQQARNAASGVMERGQQSLGAILEESGREVGDRIAGRIDRMSQMVRQAEQGAAHESKEFVGIDEDKILTFVNDKRSIRGIGLFFLGLFVLLVLPGFFKLIAFGLLALAAASFCYGYVMRAKVDVPEGFSGVVCHKGKPEKESLAQAGRSWFFAFTRFIPFLVSDKQDQVVTLEVANFTRDFASVVMKLQVVFRVTGPTDFVEHTSPALVMRLMQVYARYTALRMITSIKDTRIRFTGRDDLSNVAAELNKYLGKYGITVIRVTMPSADNAILADLEKIGVTVTQANALTMTKAAQLEAGVKAVETEIRTLRRNALGLAQALRNEAIEYHTNIAVSLNGYRQELVIRAQRDLMGAQADVTRAVAGFVSKVAMVKALTNSLDGIELGFKLRWSDLKRRALLRLMPKDVRVVNVEGIGVGLGYAFKGDLLRNIFEQDVTPEAVVPVKEHVHIISGPLKENSE